MSTILSTILAVLASISVGAYVVMPFDAGHERKAAKVAMCAAVATFMVLMFFLSLTVR